MIYWAETLLLDTDNAAHFPVGISDEHMRLNIFLAGTLDRRTSIFARVLTPTGKELFKKFIQFLHLSVIHDRAYFNVPLKC